MVVGGTGRTVSPCIVLVASTYVDALVDRDILGIRAFHQASVQELQPALQNHQEERGQEHLLERLPIHYHLLLAGVYWDHWRQFLQEKMEAWAVQAIHMVVEACPVDNH